MAASMTALVCNDAVIKFLGDAVPLFQIMTVRGAFVGIALAVMIVATGAWRIRMSLRDWVLGSIRGVLELVGTFFYLTALLKMPIANLQAIIQTLPLTVALGAAVFLGEPIGWRRMLAIIIGFLGVMLIVQPGTDGFTVFALYGLVTVFTMTARDLVVRKMSPDAPALVVALLAAIAVFVGSLLASLQVPWVAVSGVQIGWIGLASALLLAAYVTGVLGMQIGEISFVSPFRYAALLAALILGLVFFDEWPDWVALLGAGLVVATGVYTIWRERLVSDAGLVNVKRG